MGLGSLPGRQKAQWREPAGNLRTAHPEEPSTWAMERKFRPRQGLRARDALTLGEAQRDVGHAVVSRQSGDEDIHRQQACTRAIDAAAIKLLQSGGVVEAECPHGRPPE